METPHIDSLLDLICTNYFASSPVCPFPGLLGIRLYPQATGSPSNNLPLNDSIVTFSGAPSGVRHLLFGKVAFGWGYQAGWAPAEIQVFK